MSGLQVSVFLNNHSQNSVFRGNITPSNIINLRTDLKDVIHKTYKFEEEVKGTKINF